MQKSSEPIGRNMSRRSFLQLGAVGGALTALNSIFSGCSSVTHKLFDASILDDVSAGDIITLGTVRFTDNWLGRFSKDLEWRVLDVEDNRVLVITRNIIDLVDFNERRRGWEGVRSWEVSNLRHWLNNEFLSGLPEGMADHVLLTQVTNEPYPEYQVNGDPDTEDKVFLLSIGEVEKYFSSEEDRRAGFDCTSWAINRIKLEWGVDITKWRNNEDCASWWLRTIKNKWSESSEIYRNRGYLISDGQYSIAGGLSDELGVRPALWLSR